MRDSPTRLGPSFSATAGIPATRTSRRSLGFGSLRGLGGALSRLAVYSISELAPGASWAPVAGSFHELAAVHLIGCLLVVRGSVVPSESAFKPLYQAEENSFASTRVAPSNR